MQTSAAQGRDVSHEDIDLLSSRIDDATPALVQVECTVEAYSMQVRFETEFQPLHSKTHGLQVAQNTGVLIGEVCTSLQPKSEP
jgi:hypothetical protein